jgi:hypothetical protein
MFLAGIFGRQFLPAFLAGIFARRAHTGPVEIFASVPPF